MSRRISHFLRANFLNCLISIMRYLVRNKYQCGLIQLSICNMKEEKRYFHSPTSIKLREAEEEWKRWTLFYSRRGGAAFGFLKVEYVSYHHRGFTAVSFLSITLPPTPAAILNTFAPEESYLRSVSISHLKYLICTRSQGRMRRSKHPRIDGGETGVWKY